MSHTIGSLNNPTDRISKLAEDEGFAPLTKIMSAPGPQFQRLEKRMSFNQPIKTQDVWDRDPWGKLQKNASFHSSFIEQKLVF